MDPYSVLGVSRTASKDDIKKAYRKLALQHHPDRGGDENKFKELSQAHTILTDDNKRRNYDLTGSVDADARMPFNPFDLFGGMFRQPQSQTVKLPPKVVVIEVELENMWKGSEVPVRVTLQKRCSCHKRCEWCKGSGQMTELQSLGPFRHMIQFPCKFCEATGQIMQGCSKCKNGMITEEHKQVITIPARCYDQFETCYPEWGDQPKRPTEQAGDLIIQLKTKAHPLFSREGNSLVYCPTLSLTDSLIGPDIEIPLFDEQIGVRLADWGPIDPRKRYTLLQKGMKNERGELGNLIVQFHIEYAPLSESVRNGLKEIFNVQ